MAGVTRRRTLGMAGAAAAAPALSGRPHTPERIVYVGGYADGVSVFRMDRHGALTLAQTVAGVPNPSWLALHPCGTALYAISEVSRFNGQAGGGVTALTIDPASGFLTRINDQIVPGTPAHVAVDPAGGHLVVANYTGANFTVLRLRADGGVDPVTHAFAVTGIHNGRTGRTPIRSSSTHRRS